MPKSANQNAVAITDLDAAASLIAREFPLQDVEKDSTGILIFKLSLDSAAALGQFYTGGLVSAQAFSAALRRQKKGIHTRRDPYNASHSAR